MKKLIALVLTMVCVFSIMGCNNLTNDLQKKFPEYYNLDAFKGVEVYVWQTEEGEYACIPVSVGNPHAVIFTEDVYAISLPAIGPVIERHPAFPDGANVEFAELTAPQTHRVRVWERGSGVTMACGTGACAVAAAAVTVGICHADEMMHVLLDGGTLQIRFDADRTIVMTGPAEFVYEGETCLC